MKQNLATAIGVGHSHAWALQRASESVRPFGYELTFPLVGSKCTPNGLVATNSAGEQMIEPLLDPSFPATEESSAVVVSALYGNGHFWMTAAESPEPYDICHPMCSEPLANRRMFPVSLMIDIFRRTDAQLAPFFQLLMARGYHRIVQISAPPPPPKPGSAIVEKVRSLGGVLAHPLLVLKAWHCQNDALRSICLATGALFVEPPPEALTPEGYTRPELLRDGMHGTTEYADMALKKAFSEIRAQQ